MVLVGLAHFHDDGRVKREESTSTEAEGKILGSPFARSGLLLCRLDS
jgi:hypothetical protein